MRKLFLISLFALAVLGCKKSNYSGEYFDFDSIVITGECSELTATSVRISASYNPPVYWDPYSWGVVISPDNPELTERNYWMSRYKYRYDSEFKSEWSFDFNNLQPGTTYYYRAFLISDLPTTYEKPTLGAVKTFTTLSE